MKVVILKGATKSFALKDDKKKGFGINIAVGDDMIEIFQQANESYKSWKLIEELDQASKIVDQEYDASIDEVKYLISSCSDAFELLNKSFLLGYSRAMKAGACHE